jgi:hypothetical protein
MRLIRRHLRPPRHPRPLLVAGVAMLCAMSFILGTATPQGNAQAALAAMCGGTLTGGPTTSDPCGGTATGPTSTTSPAPAQAGCPKPDPNFWPFGVVCGRDYNVPSPPQSPSLVPTITTKTTTRIWGTDPFQEAVSVTQHVFPAAISVNDPNETNNVPDRAVGRHADHARRPAHRHLGRALAALPR